MKKTLIALATCLAMVGCNSQKAAEQVDIIGKWNIEKAMGQSTEGAETPAFISFDKEGHVNGNASVNLFSGSYKLDGNKLVLENVGMTRMMGQSMEIERAITDALNEVSTIQTQGNSAVIFNEKNDSIMILSK